MKNFFEQNKTLVIGIAIVLVAVFAYLSFFRSEQSSSLIVGQSTSDTISQLGAEVLSALNQLDVLRLDKDIFQDPVLNSLRDFSVPIPSQPVGRPNPFAPLGDEGSLPSAESSRMNINASSDDDDATSTDETNS